MIGAALGLYYLAVSWRPIHWGHTGIGLPLPEATSLILPAVHWLTNPGGSTKMQVFWWMLIAAAVWALYIAAFWLLARLWFREVSFTTILARLWWSCLPYLAALGVMLYMVMTQSEAPFRFWAWVGNRMTPIDAKPGGFTVFSVVALVAAVGSAAIQLTGVRKMYKAKWPGAIVLAGLCAVTAGAVTWGAIYGIRHLIAFLATRV